MNFETIINWLENKVNYCLSELSQLSQLSQRLGVDWIVEQGTRGIWTYRKWNSGIAECWGKSEHTVEHYATLNGFYAYYVDIALPFTFAAVPIKTFLPQIGSGFSIPAADMADSTTTVRLYALSNVGGTNTVKATIYVKGRWK